MANKEIVEIPSDSEPEPDYTPSSPDYVPRSPEYTPSSPVLETAPVIAPLPDYSTQPDATKDNWDPITSDDEFYEDDPEETIPATFYPPVAVMSVPNPIVSIPDPIVSVPDPIVSVSDPPMTHPPARVLDPASTPAPSHRLYCFTPGGHRLKHTPRKSVIRTHPMPTAPVDEPAPKRQCVSEPPIASSVPVPPFVSSVHEVGESSASAAARTAPIYEGIPVPLPDLLFIQSRLSGHDDAIRRVIAELRALLSYHTVQTLETRLTSIEDHAIATGLAMDSLHANFTDVSDSTTTIMLTVEMLQMRMQAMEDSMRIFQTFMASLSQVAGLFVMPPLPPFPRGPY